MQGESLNPFQQRTNEMMQSVNVQLSKTEMSKLAEISAKESRNPFQQATFYVREALEFEDDAEEVDNLLGPRLTLGSVAWLNGLSIEELYIIADEILPVFDHYYKNRIIDD